MPENNENKPDKIPARPAGGSNGVNKIILHKEILIPKYNEYPFEKAEEWVMPEADPPLADKSVLSQSADTGKLEAS